MSIRRLLATTTAAVVSGLALAAPAAAQVSIAEEDSGGSGRNGAFAAVGLAIVGVLIGLWALRSARRVAAIVTLVLALAGLVAGVVALAGSDEAIGTGNGTGGAAVAVVLALIGLGLGGTALVRSRKAA